MKGEESIHCNGTWFGKYTQINISQHTCNTHACPTSTPGNEPTSCSTFCGNATQTSTSTSSLIKFYLHCIEVIKCLFLYDNHCCNLISGKKIQSLVCIYSREKNLNLI